MKTTTSGDYVVSKCRALLLLIVFIGSLIAVGVLVYFLADRPYPAAATNGATASASSSSSTTTNKKGPRRDCVWLVFLFFSLSS